MTSSLLSAIGRTPLVRLANLFANERGIRVYAKLEMLNPGGSAKDRPALRMLTEAWKDGRLAPGATVVESSSGNTAISLAMICAQLGLRLICVVDPRTAGNNLAILQALGASIDYVREPDPDTGEFLPARINRARQLQAEIPGVFWTNQYGNEDNWRSHLETMQEILDAAGPVDYVAGAVSTCGTMAGCAKKVRELGLPTRIVAVDSEASAILGEGKGVRRFPGIGAGIVPPFGQTRFWDEAVTVSDREMVEGCRELALREGLMAGPSSGGVIAAVRRLLPKMPDGAVCALILHDRGERYMDTVFSDEWVNRQFGDVESHDKEDETGCSS
ncbi:2,3-diaminopropionate biosynthesis protein SbnA [Cohnella caldifontis]|uniref:2,3-diaminopropionate biosynthesis protein SbnA n=1 Tax=Cohnella caldifontis TaxID=3027471 RepID=UPI0023EB8C6A|nr:2,3-diaminopropionate biosynthesis protein SbnA [Cohnella sp. YIM B05605]